MPSRDDDAVLPPDIEIARSATTRPIEDVAGELGLGADDIERHGASVAKLRAETLSRLQGRETDGKLILVTSMTATRRGAGKTVNTVGLGQALHRLGEQSAIAVREPSLGPVFGIKGGAAGGGYSQVLPMEDINLHFTGDIHALTAAHNLLAAMVDAHVHHGNDLAIDVTDISWKRSLDVNDRALRETVVGLGGSANGPPREDGTLITAASELMAVLCLASDLPDLRDRVGRIVVASDESGDPVTAGDVGATGAVTALLRDALRPNLVQTIEGSPAFVHGGPFANIATGTNSVVADRVGLTLADYLVTEAGFGADLGFEKFADIVSRQGVAPDAAVLVVNVRALKHHGLDMWPVDDEAIAEPNPEAVRAGLDNLNHHAAILRTFGVPFVVAVNRFPDDTDAEVNAVLDHCEDEGMDVVVSTAHRNGTEGAMELARTARDLADGGASDFEPLYEVEAPIAEKLETIATEVYGARDVEFTGDARDDLARLERQGFDELPVCISKTAYSVTDDPAVKGDASDWTLTVRELYPSAGAGFVVALTGDVMTMPGLPAHPRALDVEVDDDGNLSGLF